MSKKAQTQSIHTATTIPLSQLTAWEGNVRKTASDAGIDQLAANISVHGVLQPLIIQKGEDGAFLVIAGLRRLMALSRLQQDGTINDDFPVPCNLVESEANATEISLTENVMREQMHPADQYEAFRELASQGMKIAQIATRFGVSKKVVQQRLALADVSPVILDAYRKGELDLEQVMAYTASLDHERQAQVFKQYNRTSAYHIRSLLTENEVLASDRRVKFVTLKAYKEAGGAVRQDLFSKDSGGGYLDDVGLLNKLVSEKLGKEAKKVKKEGWKWVEIHPDFSHTMRHQMKLEKVWPTQAPLESDQQKELEGLQAERKQILHDINGGEATDEQEKRLDEIDERLEQLEDRPELYQPEVMAHAGAVVSLSYQGTIEIDRGFVKPEDQKEIAGNTQEDGAAGLPSDSTGEKAEKGFSAKLVHELTSHKTAAIGAELASNPDIALRAVVHAMGLGLLYAGRGRGNNCLKVSASRTYLAHGLDKPELCKGADALREMGNKWSDSLPGNGEEFWQWCLDQDRETLLELLAYMAGLSVDTIVQKPKSSYPEGEDLALAIGMDMASWFTPTAENYFKHVSRAQILSDISGMGQELTPTMEKMKKGDLADHAGRIVKSSESQWIPALFRKSQ